MGLIELTGFDSLLSLFGLLYWAIAIVALGLVLFRPKTRKNRMIATACVLLVFGILPVSGLIRHIESTQRAEAKAAHVAKGIERFKAYCQKKAGVKIHRTIEGVEGIYLMKVRTTGNFNNQYAMTDPYGDDAHGDDYIMSFLYRREKNGQLLAWYVSRAEDPTDLRGYRFVEAIDPKDEKLYRFTGKVKAVRQMDVTAPGVKAELAKNPNYDVNIYEFVLDRELIAQRTARYGVTYDDISTHEDRDYWIAGSSLRVIDLQTNEVIAERIGYMMDYGQGPDGAARQGWTYARDSACPPVADFQTREFTEQSLHVAK